jgi:hypothetical protein
VKRQEWLRDAVLGIMGSLLVWLVGQMRDDFKSLVVAVNQLTVKMEVLANQVTSESFNIKDHETRLRDLENDHHVK